MKTHYAIVEKANESDTQDYWSSTACGLEYTEAPMTDVISNITCINCKKVLLKATKILDKILKNEQKTGN